MIRIDDAIRQLRSSADVMRAMLQTIPAEQAAWKPDPESWSLKETMTHIYNEERIDFRKHLKEVLSDPLQSWVNLRDEDLLSVDTCQQALEGFLTEREASIAWLKALKSPDWDRQIQAPWGPISAGDLLISWVEHDFLHLRQLNEVLHAWNVAQGAPYSVRYAGGW